MVLKLSPLPVNELRESARRAISQLASACKFCNAMDAVAGYTSQRVGSLLSKGLIAIVGGSRVTWSRLLSSEHKREKLHTTTSPTSETWTRRRGRCGGQRGCLTSSLQNPFTGPGHGAFFVCPANTKPYGFFSVRDIFRELHI